MKNEFYFPSKDTVTRIHATEWVPEGKIKAVLQICHGMAEYVDRYDEFGAYLAERGYYVVGHDHLGHGKSIQSEAEYGFFHEKNGNQYVIGDIHCLRQRTEKAHPGVPYFMLGHSMGSFLIRQYIERYGQGLAGAVIMGTGEHSPIELWAGKLLCKLLRLLRGSHYRSRLVNNMALGGYNKHFNPARTTADWISKDTAIVDKYVSDPCCTFVFTVNGYYHMFSGMQESNKQENMNRIPKELPLLFTSGKEDPVGNFGKSVEKVYRKYIACGLQNVSMKLYEGDRHEILNETDRQQVYADVWTWLEEQSEI